MPHHRMHFADFRRDAVRVTRTGGTLSHAARELGLTVSLHRKTDNFLHLGRVYGRDQALQAARGLHARGILHRFAPKQIADVIGLSR